MNSLSILTWRNGKQPDWAEIESIIGECVRKHGTAPQLIPVQCDEGTRAIVVATVRTTTQEAQAFYDAQQ